ncbi:MOSC N-terminal [Glarea lozoyensis ATCC 20868]|uniref:MOSC N-terminal n=1 Tax=Glarea lozoyensis (strain ATCC 20868 / MF5171) TaxID=1116229 RepID=S3D7G9_GLAL2|nr:MOSC N-terminal [Glarea lozoyensis ATCC 20868]EPE33079.1 MOSC N-terminal [Glarea lozoyensis ATCC 20868]
MAAIIEQYKQLAEQYYERYSEQLWEAIPVFSTTTYVLTTIAVCLPPIIALVIYEREQAKLLAEQPQGCRKLGMKIESNLLNEFDKKFSEGRPPSTEETSAEWWRLKSMWIYPVKSCKGVELNRGTIISTGMEYDRQFTFAQLKSPFPVNANTPEKDKAAHKWEFITQRQFPLLANVRTEMWMPDQSVDTYKPHCDDVESGGVIIMSFPWQEPGWKAAVARWGGSFLGRVPEKQFRVPFDPTPVQIEKAGYSFEKMTIWKDTVNSLNLEIDIPEELRYYLGISNKLGLFRIDNSKLREVHKMAPTKAEIGYQPVTGFQDSYPLHLVNLASVRDVESKMPYVKGAPRLSATRFRPNLIITGPEAYNEDTWRKIKIGFYEYYVSCRTTRCKLPNVDQSTGQNHASEPDKTLRSFRAVDEGAGPNVGCLGVQMIPISKESALRVGDEITVLETGEHRYIK